MWIIWRRKEFFFVLAGGVIAWQGMRSLTWEKRWFPFTGRKKLSFKGPVPQQTEVQDKPFVLLLVRCLLVLVLVLAVVSDLHHRSCKEPA